MSCRIGLIFTCRWGFRARSQRLSKNVYQGRESTYLVWQLSRWTLSWERGCSQILGIQIWSKDVLMLLLISSWKQIFWLRRISKWSVRLTKIGSLMKKPTPRKRRLVQRQCLKLRTKREAMEWMQILRLLVSYKSNLKSLLLKNAKRLFKNQKIYSGIFQILQWTNWTT